MRLSIRGWSTTLKRLGYRALWDKLGVSPRKHRPAREQEVDLHVETLEPRQMLSGVPLVVAEGTVPSFSVDFADATPSVNYSAEFDWGNGQTSSQLSVSVDNTDPNQTQLVVSNNGIEFSSPGVHDVTLTLTDLDDQEVVGTYQAKVAVLDDVPRILVSASSAQIDTASPYSIEFSATHPTVDTVTGWTVLWGDGTFDTYAASATNAVHQYTQVGDYPVSVQATFSDNSTSTAALSFDSSFGNHGVVTTDFSGESDVAQKVLVQPDGKIVSVVITKNGTQKSNFGLVRYLPNGSLDTSFGSGGKVSLDFSTSQNLDEFANSLTLQADGKILVAG